MWLVVSFIWYCSQIPCKHCCTLALPANINIIRAGEPGHEVGLSYYFAFFFLLKELWVDHVQLQLTKKKKKKNTKYLLERRGGTNGALSGHYISCQSSPFPPNCLLVTIDVSALYLNIPQDEGPSECLRSLENRDLLRLPRNIMQTLFDIVLKCNTT